MKIEQFAPNHTIVRTDKTVNLFSYETKVVQISDNEVFLDPKHDTSKTTSKYVNQFLGVTTKERKQRIKDNDYIVKPLNQ